MIFSASLDLFVKFVKKKLFSPKKIKFHFYFHPLKYAMICRQSRKSINPRTQDDCFNQNKQMFPLILTPRTTTINKGLNNTTLWTIKVNMHCTIYTHSKI